MFTGALHDKNGNKTMVKTRMNDLFSTKQHNNQISSNFGWQGSTGIARDEGTRRGALLGETRSSGTEGSHPGQGPDLPPGARPISLSRGELRKP